MLHSQWEITIIYVFIILKHNKQVSSVLFWVLEWTAHNLLQLRSRQHEGHLLSQHGSRGLLLDQVVSPVNLQLSFQVWRWVQVFTVLSCAATLKMRWKEVEWEVVDSVTFSGQMCVLTQMAAELTIKTKQKTFSATNPSLDKDSYIQLNTTFLNKLLKSSG